MTRKHDEHDRDEDADKPVKAYKDMDFMQSRAGRPMRILAEFLEPEDRFERFNVSDTIVFFGSARILSREVAEQELASAKKHGGDVGRAEQNLAMSRYYEEARELSRRLTEWSKGLKGTLKALCDVHRWRPRHYGGRQSWCRGC
ncbi:MAG: hypothetical protein JKY27_09275 [Magnetovibrio sp.]|nr:hypothetical protein [Magnetovibrio sp.]